MVSRTLILATAISLGLTACSELTWRHSPERTVSNVLTGRGYEVEEVSTMTDADKAPEPICGKAYATVFYRARRPDHEETVGVGCYQRDGSVTFPQMPSAVS